MYMVIIHQIFFFLILVKYTFEDYEKNCLEVQLCQIPGEEKKIRCSINGKCFYSLFNYLAYEGAKGDFFTCLCNRGYTTVNKDDYESVFCCYKQKEQFYAFVLELIPMIGLGHLYAGRKTNFIVKICICLVLGVAYVICCILIRYFYRKRIEQMKTQNDPNNSKDPNNLEGIEVIINVIKIACMVIIIIFQIWDLLHFALNSYKDGNDVSLYPW
ncbi:MAG: hypothetical protein MJ252_12120 [archaeon]|nr:hypothetical protein [archaeon]